MSKLVKIILMTLLLALTAGCGKQYHGPLSLPTVSPETAANLVIIVERAFFADGASFIPAIDGVEAYSLNQNQYVTILVPPGEHTVTSKFGHVHSHITNKSVIKISPKNGETIYLHFIAHQNIFTDPGPYVSVTRIPEEQALQLMKEATRVGP